jgi:DNA-directed RNA polymerase II subunit RPB2
MYNGETGIPYQSKIYVGIASYQKLKHLVAEKIHARNREGASSTFTQQPAGGRTKDGGLRFGEMEKDCAIVHGIASFLRERLFTMSDPYAIDVCSNCGVIVNEDSCCTSCGCARIVNVYIPYACKLLLHEIQAVMIKACIQAEN